MSSAGDAQRSRHVDGTTPEAVAEADVALGAVLTVPNVITTLRLLSVGLFLWLVLRPGRAGWYPAGLLLGGLGVTDGVDGFVARRFQQVSTLGKILDPLADRVLLSVAGVSTIALGAVPVWVGLVVVGREMFVSGAFLVLAALGARRMDVSRAGKAATFATMCAFPLFLAGHANDDWRSLAETLAWVFVVPGMVVGWYSVVGYFRPALGELNVGRRDRAARRASGGGAP